MSVKEIENCPKCKLGFLEIIEQSSHLEPTDDDKYKGYYLDKYQCDKCGYIKEITTNFTMTTSGVIEFDEK